MRADGEGADLGFVMPVQRVNRPNLDFRGFAGTVASGSVRPGDEILALPSGSRARVSRIVTFDGDLASAGAGQAVTLTLDREIDVSRGDVLTKAGRFGDDGAAALTEVDVRLLVTADRRIAAGDSFIVQIGTASAVAQVVAIDHATDIASGDRRAAAALSLNDLGQVRLRFDRPVVGASYARSRVLGALILIDRLTNATAAMGTILPPQTAGVVDDRVVALRRVADRTLRQAIGPQWRQELAPAASWRIGSALLLGLIVTMATDNPAFGLVAALLDAALRPLLRFVHRRIWTDLRERASASRDNVSEGGGI